MLLAPGETCREAAVRELAEETGIRGVALTFAVVAEFARWSPGEPVDADMSPLDAEPAARVATT